MIKNALASWKTTSTGLLLIITGITRLAFAIKAGGVTEESIVTVSTTILGGVGLLFARDNSTTSEDAGAVNKPTIVIPPTNTTTTPPQP